MPDRHGLDFMAGWQISWQVEWEKCPTCVIILKCNDQLTFLNIELKTFWSLHHNTHHVLYFVDNISVYLSLESRI